MPSSSTAHGGQYDTEYVTFMLLLHAAFVTDEIWGDMFEPARTHKIPRVKRGRHGTAATKPMRG